MSKVLDNIIEKYPDEEFLIADGFDAAVIGIDLGSGRLIYSVKRCLRILMDEDMNYIDAIVHFCELNSIDVEFVPKLITKPLKDKVKCEAQELNFLKRSSRAKLPI